MASGGQQIPPRGIRACSNQSNQHDDISDNQWTILPNNLDFNSRSRPAKKQRNKEKPRKRISTESSPSPCLSPCTGRNSSHPFIHVNVPRTWHNEQILSGAMKKNLSCDLEEIRVSSDAELLNMERRNSGSQRHQIGRSSDPQISRRGVTENENSAHKQDNTKKAPDTNAVVERLMELRECIKQVTSLMQSLEKSDEPISRDQINKLEVMLTQLHQEEQEHLELLQRMLVTNEDSTFTVDNGTGEPNASQSMNIGPVIMARESGEENEDRSSRQNQILKKMLESQEKLEALKEQQAALLSLQKTAEDRLAEARAFHEKLLSDGHGNSESLQDGEEFSELTQEWQYAASDRIRATDSVPNGDADVEINGNWQSSLPRNIKKTHLPNHGNRNFNIPIEWNVEPRESSSDGISCLDTIRQQIEYLQELNSSKKRDKVLMEENDDTLRATATVEKHRQKLENKLRELNEKKQQMDQLLQELSTLQATSKSGATVDPSMARSAIRDTQEFLDAIDIKDRKRKLDQMKDTIRELKTSMNNACPGGSSSDQTSRQDNDRQTVNFATSSSQRETYESSVHYQTPSSQSKKDNISREQSSGFPARRHYEAEGRANEDIDSAPPVPLPVPPLQTALDPSWENNPQLQDKMKQLQDARDKLASLQSLISAIQESKNSGQSLTMEHFQLLASLENATVGHDSPNDNDETSSTQVNERSDFNEDVSSGRRQMQMDRLEEAEDRMIQQENDLEKLLDEKKKLLSFHEQLTRLKEQQQQHLVTPASKNNEQLRSSAEGDNLQKKRQQTLPSELQFSGSSDADHLTSLRDRSRHDNLLLTRQNVAAIESQTQLRVDNKSTIQNREINASKKYVNNISANLVRKVQSTTSINPPVEQISESRSAESLSALSDRLNESLSLRNELRRKTAILEDIISRDCSKQQCYSRNQDTRSRSGSSVNSEPLEGSNSVLAPDTTVAATWGGSSTQDNLEDEEPVESLEEQDEEDGSGNDARREENIHNHSRFSTSQQLYQGYLDHNSTVTNRRNNRLGFQPEFKGGHVNHWTPRKNFQRVNGNGRIHMTSDPVRQENLLNVEAPPADAEDLCPQNISAPDANANSTLWHKFSQQFQQHLEHMNALFHSVLQEQQVLTSRLLSISIVSPPAATAQARHSSQTDVQQYSQQLQQQQQLLLSLSQCYHMLYLQQLEIQYLQRCLQQGPESEVNGHQTSPVNIQAATAEEFNFRPWMLTPWLNAPVAFSYNGQSAGLPSAGSPFIQPSMFGQASSNATGNTLSSTPQTTRNTVPTVNQDIRVAAETLNNQVPPRTRANNFWDNFRSYSRQNLLSTSTQSKSNEIAGTLQNQQSVLSTGGETTAWNHCVREQPNIFTGSGVNSSNNNERHFDRSLPNTEVQELITARPKKPNLNKHQSTISRTVPQTFRNQGSSNISSSTLDQIQRPAQSTEQAIQNQNGFSSLVSSGINISSPSHRQFDCKFVEPDSKSTVMPNSSLQESIYAEVTKLVAQNETSTEFLMNLYRNLQQFTTEESFLPKASKGLRTTASRESNNLKCQEVKTMVGETDHNLSNELASQSAHSSTQSREPQYHSRHLGLEADSEQLSRCSGDSQQILGASTGAVKKKLSSKLVQANEHSAQKSTSSLANVSSQTAQKDGGIKYVTSVLEEQIEQVIISLIPFLKSHTNEEFSLQLQTQLCTKLLELTQNVPEISSQSIRSHQLLHLVQKVLTKFAGLKIKDCEEEIIKNITEMLLKEVSVHKVKQLQRQLKEESTSSAVTKDYFQVSDGKNVIKNELEENLCNYECSDSFDSQGTEESTRDDKKGDFNSTYATQIDHEVFRAAVGCEAGDGYNFHTPSRSSQGATQTAEEDMSYECDPEGETEPEVEAEIETDLAEADQSSSQVMTTIADPIFSRQADSPSSVAIPSNSVSSNSSGIQVDYNGIEEDKEEGNAHGQVSGAEGESNEELCLDDVPTKLSSLSENAIQMQMNEEQASTSLLQDVLSEDITLVGNDTDIREPSNNQF